MSHSNRVHAEGVEHDDGGSSVAVEMSAIADGSEIPTMQCIQPVEDGDIVPANVEDAQPIPSGKSACLSSVPVFTIVDDLRYEVNVTKDKVTTKKAILDGISVVIQPGKVTAIMGPSGCGKSTFLDCLAGRIEGNNLSGRISMNKKPRENFRGKFAYVMQGDALVGTMTVRENLMFSANIREPHGADPKLKVERVDSVIDALGMRRVADTKVGTALIRGISGGEMRRASIGVELVNCPSVIFLDEPTSGLDSSASFFVVKALRDVTRTGRAVVMTIHQPPSEVFEMIDHLILLSAGKMVYSGPREGALHHFESCGYPCAPFTNPADHYLRTIATDFELGTGAHDRVNALVSSFKESETHKTEMRRIHECCNEKTSESLSESSHHHNRSFPTSWWRQFSLLSERNLKYFTRDPSVFGIRLAMYMMLAICMGTIYLKVGFEDNAIQDRASILFFTSAFLTFMAISALPAMITERTIFYRERINHNYHVSAYVMANFLVSLPFLFITAAVTSSIMYFLVFLHNDAGRFFFFMLMLFLSLAVCESLMTAIGSIAPSFFVGLAVASGFLGIYMLLCGFFRFVGSIPNYWIWGYYISFHTYAFSAFMWNDFEGLVFKNGMTGEQLLDVRFDLAGKNKWHSVAVLCAMAVIYRFFQYLLLKYLQRGTRK